MREQSPNHFFGLDIGTSTVRCVVGMLDEADHSKPSIIGHGSAPNVGLRKGVVVHVDDVVEAMSRIIERPPQGDAGWSGAKPDPSSSKAPWKIW